MLRHAHFNAIFDILSPPSPSHDQYGNFNHISMHIAVFHKWWRAHTTNCKVFHSFFTIDGKNVLNIDADWGPFIDYCQVLNIERCTCIYWGCQGDNVFSYSFRKFAYLLIEKYCLRSVLYLLLFCYFFFLSLQMMPYGVI